MYTKIVAFLSLNLFQSPLVTLLHELTPTDQQQAKLNQTFKDFEKEIGLLTSQHLLPQMSEPGLVIAGSNFRGTALAPITHVNVLFVLDPSLVSINEQDVMVSLTSPDIFLQRLKNPSGLLQPALLTKALLTVLSERFSAKLSFYGQSIRLTIKKNPIEIVLTPAIPVRSGYLIPEEKSELLWKKIDPEKEKEILNKLNQRHSGNVITTIRCMKLWNEKKNTSTFRGYHLEAIAYQVFEEIPTPITSLLQALELYATHMSKYIYNCPDPAHPTESLNQYLPDSIDQWYLFMNRVGELKSVIGRGEKELAEYLRTEIRIAE